MNKRMLALIVFAAVAVCAPAYAENVALLINTDFVDYGSGLDSEAENLENQIPFFGHTVTSFTSVVDTDLADTLVGQDALVIPELEGPDNISVALGPAGRTVIEDFVTNGGTFVAFVTGEAIDLVNDTFGFSLGAVPARGSNEEGQAARGGGDDPYFVTSQADGTTFEGGPFRLFDLNATQDIALGDLPVGGLPIYQDLGGNDAAVVAIPFGDGWVALLGWDWFQGFLDDSRGGGGPNHGPASIADWNAVLDRAIRLGGSVDGVLDVPISTQGLTLLGLLLLGAGFVVLRRH